MQVLWKGLLSLEVKKTTTTKKKKQQASGFILGRHLNESLFHMIKQKDTATEVIGQWGWKLALDKLCGSLNFDPLRLL